MSSSQEIKRPAEKGNSAASGVPQNRDRVYEANQQCGGERPRAIEDWLQAEADSMPKKPLNCEDGIRKAS
jgi:hypothetical protein